MNKVRIIAIAAGSMIVLGLILAGIGFLAGGNQGIHIGRDGITVDNQDQKGIRGDIESYSQELDAFKSIDIDLSIYDVDLVPGDKYFVECRFDTESGKPSIEVENNTLIIKDSGYDGIKINLNIFDFDFDNVNHNQSVKIYYPKGTEFERIKIGCAASNLSFENINAEEAVLDLNFGDLNLSGITSKRLEVLMDSGNLKMSDINADDLEISNSFGQITLEKADLIELGVKANSGNVTLRNVFAEKSELDLDFGKLDANQFQSNGLKVESNSGEVNLQGIFLGNTEILANMGEVVIETDAAKDQYSYDLHADMGSIYVDNDKMSSIINTNKDAPDFIKVDSDMGDINIKFK